MAGKIFLSYRRKDEQGYAIALFDRLDRSFSPEKLFMDVEGGIAPGQDFVQAIEDQVNACDVMLVLIGPRWLTATDEMGRRRLDNPQDFVRIEIESALQLGKKVIPVLVGNTEMPRADALPEPLKSLTRLQAIPLAETRFGADAQGLINELESTLTKAATPVHRWLRRGLGAAIGLAAIGAVSWIYLYDESIRTFTGHSDYVHSVAFGPDGRTALSGGWDHTVRQWKLDTGEQIRKSTPSFGFFFSVAFAPDGLTALSGVKYTLKLWNIASGKEIRTFTGHSDNVEAVAFAPDGRTALSGSSDTTVRLWDVATGNEIYRFTGHESTVDSVAFAPDGRTALSGSSDRTLKLWDIKNGKYIRTFGWPDRVNSVAFAPDGHTVLSGSEDGALKLWETTSGKLIRTFDRHHNSVYSVAFGPDGRTALSGGRRFSFFGWSQTLKLWDVASGKEIRTFIGHHGSVRSLAFAPDGRTALSGSRDNTVKLWMLPGPN
jgi:WD40 repeat protein